MITFIRAIRLAVRALTIALLFGHAADSDAQPKPPAVTPPANWISIVGQQPFVMPADQKAVALPLLVSLDASVAANDVTVELFSVRYEKLIDERMTKLFSVEPSIERGAGRGAAILLKVAAVNSLPPGEYQLTIGASPKKDAAALPLDLKVERPGVQLSPIGKVSLDLFYDVPILGYPPSLFPRELRFTQMPESKFSQISEVSAFVGTFKNAQGVASGGTLKVSAATPVAAGQPLLVTVTPNGFPAGVSTGTLEIRGPDIKTPQSVELEIRARHTPFWVVVLILAGLVLGYLLRIALQRRVDLARARSSSAVIVEEIENRLSRTPDEAFTNRIKAVLKELRDALDGSDPKAIDEKAKAASAALEEAKKELETRLKATHERLRTLRAIVDRSEGLPAELSDLLRRVSETCGRYADRLAMFDETRPRHGLDATEAEFINDVRGFFYGWPLALPVRLSELERLHFVLDNGAAEDLVKATGVLRGTVESTGIPSDLAEIATALARVREVNAQVMARLDWLRETMEHDLKEFEVLFADRFGATDPTLAQLETHIAQLGSQLLARRRQMDLAEPMYEAQTRQAAANTFEKLLGIVLAKHAGTLKNDERTGFDSARTEQRYMDAVRALPASASKLKTGVTGSGVETISPPFREPEHRVGEALPAEPPPSLSTEPIATLKARTFGELAAGEGAQTAIVAVLIIGLGYILFAEKFVGTLSDIATIFLWGFTLDISVNKLLEVAAPFAAKAKVP